MTLIEVVRDQIHNAMENGTTFDDSSLYEIADEMFACDAFLDTDHPNPERAKVIVALGIVLRDLRPCLGAKAASSRSEGEPRARASVDAER